MRHARIYLDQNIVGYLRDGVIDFSRVTGIDWLYSNEHFNEISRSGDRSFLEVFKKLKAQFIEIVLDEKLRITDSTRIHPYSCPYKRYEHYIDAVGEVKIDESLFRSFLARLNGADNYGDVLSVPEKLGLQIKELLEPIGKWDSETAEAVGQVSADLDKMIRAQLSKTRPLETLRKPLGTHKRIGNPKTDSPIAEIWELVSSKANGLTADQFFGFNPLDKQGYDTWPLYLGIIGCYSTLNFIGYRTDRNIASEDAVANIISDAVHIAHGAFCDGLMSEDRRLCLKARAIYKFKNINTHVLRLEIKKLGLQPN